MAGRNPSLGNGSSLDHVNFRLGKSGSPVGSVVARLYAHTGTFGGGGTPTGAVLATSTNTVDASTLGTVSPVTFNFSPFTLTNGVSYCITMEVVETDFGASGSVVTGLDISDIVPGNRASKNTSAVWAGTTGDLVFEVWAALPAGATVISYDTPTLNVAVTTNRLTGGSGSFVAGKVSENGVVTDLGWTANNYTEVLYSLQFIRADLANGDTIRFRVLRNGATTGLTYTVTPTVNVTIVTVPPEEGSAAVTHTWATGASGVMPAAPALGSAATTYAEATLASGAMAPVGAAAYAWSVAVSASGLRASLGAAATTSAWTTTAAGVIVPLGTASTVWVSDTTAAGTRVSQGAATETWTATASAAGSSSSAPPAEARFDEAGVVRTSESGEARTLESGAAALKAGSADVTHTWALTHVPATSTTVDFESGTDESPVVAGGGITSVSGTITYESTAAFHGAMGAQAVGAAYVVITPPSIYRWEGSTYIKCVVLTSGSTRFLVLYTGSGSTIIGIRFTTTGNALVISDQSNIALNPPLTTTWSITDVFRFDWQFVFDPTADTVDMTVRVFKNANIEGTVPDETATRQVTGVVSDPATARVGSLTSGVWDVQFDTLRFGNRGWYGPYAPPSSTGQGSAAETYTVTTAASGTRTPKGDITTTHTWVTTSSGTKTPKGTAAATWSATTTATGTKTPKGAADTAYTETLAASGVAPVVGVKQGTAAVTYTETTAAQGKLTPKASAATTYTETTLAAGRKLQNGTAAIAYTEALTAAGKRTPKATAATIYTETTTAAGARTPKATAAPSHAWATTAQGVAPIVGVKQGTAAVTYTSTTAATGKRTPKGSNSVAVTWALTAAGKRIQKGTAAATYTETLTAAGKRVPKSTIVTTYTEALTALGKRVPKAYSAPSHVWVLTAQGLAPLVGFNDGFALVAHTWATAAVGKKAPRGTASASALWTPTALGKKFQTGSTLTTFRWVPTAEGKKFTQGLIIVTYTEATSATGFRLAVAAGVTSYQFVVVLTGVSGVVGVIEGSWNGQIIDAMQYGDRPVIDYILTPA